MTNRKIANHIGMDNVVLTPNKKKLCVALRQKDRQIDKLKERNAELQEKLCKWRQPHDFTSELIQQIEKPELRDLVISYFRNKDTKNPHGKRYTLNDKITGVSLLKRGAKAYQFIESIVSVPEPRTLRRTLSRVPLDSGSNKTLLNCIKSQSTAVNENDRYVILSLDEMALKIRLILPAGSNKVKGFVDYGNGDRHPDTADHVLVFMMRTLATGKKQPLSYYFVHKTTPTNILKDLIAENIKDVESAGFKVVGVVSDQGATNKAALRALRMKTSVANNSALRSYFSIDNITRKIYVLSGRGHIIKTTRNNACGDVDSWLKKQPEGKKNKLLYPGNRIKWDGKTGYWRHIIELYIFNPKLSDKLTLTEEHVFPTGKTKMRVKFAAQIFSCTVATSLRQMANFKLNEGLINALEHSKIWETASILQDIDLMFDLTNGSNKPTDPKLDTSRVKVTAASPHKEHWKRYQDIAASRFWFEYDSGKKINTPTPDALAVTLQSMQELWEDLLSEGFEELRLRYLNQDGLENFFGLMRQECGDCHHPTCLHLEAAFKTALVTRFAGTYRPGFNCEAEDESAIVVNLGELLSEDKGRIDVDLNDQNNLSIQQAPELSSDNAMFALEYFENEELNYFKSTNDDNDDFPPTLHVADNLDSCQYFFPELDNIDHKLDSDNFVALNDCVAADIIGQRLMKKLKITDCSLCKYSFTDNAEQSGLNQAFKTYVFKAIDTYNRNVLPQLHIDDVVSLAEMRLRNECNLDWYHCSNHRNTVIIKLINTLSRLLITESCKALNAKQATVEVPSANAVKVAQQMGKAK